MIEVSRLNRTLEKGPSRASGVVDASPSDDKRGRVKKHSHSVDEWALALRYGSLKSKGNE